MVECSYTALLVNEPFHVAFIPLRFSFSLFLSLFLTLSPSLSHPIFLSFSLSSTFFQFSLSICLCHSNSLSFFHPLFVSLGASRSVTIVILYFMLKHRFPLKTIYNYILSCRWWELLYYTVLYCTVVYCTVLYCCVLYCTVLYCTVVYCTVLYCCVVVVLYNTIVYFTVQYFSLFYSNSVTVIETLHYREFSANSTTLWPCSFSICLYWCRSRYRFRCVLPFFILVWCFLC